MSNFYVCTERRSQFNHFNGVCVLPSSVDLFPYLIGNDLSTYTDDEHTLGLNIEYKKQRAPVF